MSPPRQAAGTAGRAPSDSSRDRIRAAAAELARERGVAGATIAAICKRSGLPVSSVYWHFDDKDGLFADVIRASFTEWLGVVPRWEVAPLSDEGLRGLLGTSADTLPAVPDFLLVGMQVLLETGAQHERTREAFVDVRAEARRMVTTWVLAVLGDDVPSGAADDLASLLVSFSDGLLVGSQLYPDWDANPYIDLFVAVFREIVEEHRGDTTPEASRAG